MAIAVQSVRLCLRLRLLLLARRLLLGHMAPLHVHLLWRHWMAVMLALHVLPVHGALLRSMLALSVPCMQSMQRLLLLRLVLVPQLLNLLSCGTLQPALPGFLHALLLSLQ